MGNRIGLQQMKTWVAIGFAIVMLILNTVVIMDSMKKMGLFLAFLLALVFLHCPPKRGSKNWEPGLFDLLISLLGASTGFYIVFAIDGFFARYYEAVTLDYVFGAIAIVLIIEAGRRVLGWALPILALVALLYAYFGPYMPGIFNHSGYNIPHIIVFLYMRAEGIFGVTLQVASSYIILFILFGAILNESKVGEYLTQLAESLAGKTAGGPAKVAVVSSALMGTVSGSPVANVVTTGTFSIPLMKKIGFEPHIAGAVEAAASTGGAIMPPIMASAAFLMSEYLGIPYYTIALAALIPSICYYLSIYINIHFYSVKHGLVGMETVPQLRGLLKQFYMVIPVLVVFYVIFSGMTPLKAALWGMIAALIISQIKPDGRVKVVELIKGLGRSSINGLDAYVACAVVGIPVGIITMTGLGNVFADLVIGASGSMIIVALILSAVAALLMSMGMPTVPLYIVCATMLAPAVINLGAIPLAAHLFVFFWGVLSNLTPPVALASYAAAGISGGDLNKVALHSIRLTLPTFLIPFAFVLNPAILLQSQSPLLVDKILPIITLILGSCVLALAVAGYTKRQLKSIERLIMGVGAILLLDPNHLTDLIGIIISVVMIIIAFWKTKDLYIT